MVCFISKIIIWLIILSASTQPANRLVHSLKCLNFIELCHHYLYDQINDILSEDANLDKCLELVSRVKIFPSAATAFYILSEVLGPMGMHRELIYCVDS